MTDLPSLLSCLARTPEDNLLWLALADRLEEGGEAARAKLARLHRGLRETPEGEERWRTEGRIREMLLSGVRPCMPEEVNAIGMRFVLIPPGTFWMGSPEGEGDDDERPRHRVTLTRAFWLGVHPVTQSQYKAVARKNPSSYRAGGEGAEDVEGLDTSSFPVECVSWEEAVRFCKKLSKNEGAGRTYRLPTEAEWEYACRGGLISGAFHFGKSLDTAQANFSESGLHRTCPVGGYPPNAFGLHDLHGNVTEWCADWHGPYQIEAQVDPSGPKVGVYRVSRGGCCTGPARYCRAANRRGMYPHDVSYDLGLRVARDQ